MLALMIYKHGFIVCVHPAAAYSLQPGQFKKHNLVYFRWLTVVWSPF